MSLSKAQQSRINGAKSHGPTSTEGKARSSLNALIHGRYANNAIVLANEDPVAFEALVTNYVQRLQPADPVEYGFARELASIDWRLARVRALDTRLLDHEMQLQATTLATTGQRVSELTRLLHASRTVVERSHFPGFLARRESQLLQARSVTLRSLRALRKDCPLADPALEIIAPMPIDPDSFFQNEPGTNPVPTLLSRDEIQPADTLAILPGRNTTGAMDQPCGESNLPAETALQLEALLPTGTSFQRGAGFQPARDLQSRTQTTTDSAIPPRPVALPASAITPCSQAPIQLSIHPSAQSIHGAAPQPGGEPTSTSSEAPAPTLLDPGIAGSDNPKHPTELLAQSNRSPKPQCLPEPSEMVA